MISDKMKTIIAEKIVKSYYDKNKVIQEEYRTSLLHLLMSTVLCVVVCGIHLFVKSNFGDYAFSGSLFVGIFYEIPAVFIILILTSNKKEDYEIRKRLPLKCIICNILCLVEAFIIFTWIPYYFTYDHVTDTSSIGFGKLLFCAPVLFVIMVVWALIDHDPVIAFDSHYYNYNSDLYITIAKAGINPNKIPSEIYKDRYSKQLSTQDWREIGDLVLEYGYNLFTR